MLRRALRNIYSENFRPATDIEINLFDEICNKIDEATQKGFDEPGAVDPDDDFRAAILRNNEVFAAFKVHRMQNDMARLLLDSNGNLKPFEQWQKEVMPIASHQVGNWLRTEYDTAVLRARQAAVRAGEGRASQSEVEGIHLGQSREGPHDILGDGSSHRRPVLEPASAG